jgi:cell division septum initiation protein DivIVA
LFGRLDDVSRAIESTRADIEFAHDRLSELSRQIEAGQQILNRRAVEAYMGSAGRVGSMLGASSFTDVQDALEFLDAISQADHDVLVALERRRVEFEAQRARLEGLEVELSERRERLEATVANLVEKVERQQVALRRGADEPPPGGPDPDPPAPAPAPGPALGRSAVIELIRDRFASLGSGSVEVALCVAEAESGFDPLAENPATGAAGLFQFLPSTWTTLSDLGGWDAASVFDARANASVAAWTVTHYGWHPWRSVAADCSA